MKNKSIREMNTDEIKNHILELQKIVVSNINSGISIDSFLDNTKIFDEIEELIPDEEFAIFILTIINNFDSNILLDNIINTIEASILSEGEK